MLQVDYIGQPPWGLEGSDSSLKFSVAVGAHQYTFADFYTRPGDSSRVSGSSYSE